MEAFTGYTDRDIQAAADQYRREGEYFPPKPAQILALVKDRSQLKHDEELRAMWTCKRCGQKASAISEGTCLDCEGVPLPQYKRLKPLLNPDKIPFRIEGRMKCQQCGYIGQCIKEPVDDGPWLCKECYSGMTAKEIMHRLNNLTDDVGERIPF